MCTGTKGKSSNFIEAWATSTRWSWRVSWGNKQWATEEIKEEIKNHRETNGNKNMTIQHLWDAAKTVLRGKFTAIQARLRKQEKSQINNPILCLKQLKKNKQNPKLGSSHPGSEETNLTSIHDDAGLICGLTQCVKDPALLWLWCRLVATIPI